MRPNKVIISYHYNRIKGQYHVIKQIETFINGEYYLDFETLQKKRLKKDAINEVTRLKSAL